MHQGVHSACFCISDIFVNSLKISKNTYNGDRGRQRVGDMDCWPSLKIIGFALASKEIAIQISVLIFESRTFNFYLILIRLGRFGQRPKTSLDPYKM